MKDSFQDNCTINETDLTKENLEFFTIQTKRLQKRFNSRRINFYSCNNIQAGQKTLNSLVNKFKREDSITKIGFSDSVSLHQLDAFNLIDSMSDVEVINPFIRFSDGKLAVYGKQPPGKLNLPKDEYYDLMDKLHDKMRESMMTDIFIIGANAITMKGQIVSTDGTGNRVAGMIFGPKRVIIVVGVNKIVETVDEAIKRNRNVAAPLNFIRHNIKHHNRFDPPCLTIGYCTDCNHKRRGCLNTVIIDGAMEAHKDRLHLILINENLGF